MGVKVHDDPKLLKRSLQKEKKRREKSAGKWKDKVETQEKMKEEKQAKRRGNIEERANQKKARKIAKREKKLMRPGFEGRKEGYIGEKSG
ncbi:putative ribosomal RNA-processing protein 14/surfeit locus protein [Helianthus annuus]|nr:putative ribosomal RNA-processing protein 14/surfeit locus protein [Helianthus annuus]